MSSIGFFGSRQKFSLHFWQLSPSVLCWQSSQMPPDVPLVFSYNAWSKWQDLAWLWHRHLRHSFAWPLLAGSQGLSLKSGKHFSQFVPQVLCWHWHWPSTIPWDIQYIFRFNPLISRNLLEGNWYLALKPYQNPETRNVTDLHYTFIFLLAVIWPYYSWGI